MSDSDNPDRTSGARELTVEWRGPFHFRQALRLLKRGLYLLSVGQEPLYIGASLELPRQLGAHVVYHGSHVSAGDMLGRELLKFTRSHNARLHVKLAVVRDADSGREITDLTTLEDVVSLLTYHRHLPCNPYGRDRYEGSQPLIVHNLGKHHPLEREYRSPPLPDGTDGTDGGADS